MINGDLTYEQLLERLRNAEAIIEALRKNEIDAILSEKSVALVRLREVEDQLVEARRIAEERADDLEAFSYSVSHDLRNPLLTVKGFSDMLLSDYAHQLDSTEVNYIKHIISGVNKMTDLIDDILQLSVVTNHDLQKRTTDLSELVNTIFSELKMSDPHRHVLTEVAQNLTAQADRKLIAIALTNLCNNAWKFTSKKDVARIEFGVLKENDPVFFIRDNGVGFDMNNGRALFIPFKRLHPENQFSGTGIGLAIVKRVIEKHGGKIWAEGNVGKGAVFYFTL